MNRVLSKDIYYGNVKLHCNQCMNLLMEGLICTCVCVCANFGLNTHSVCANFGLNTHSVCANFSLIARSPVYSVHLVKIRKCMCTFGLCS